MQRQEKELQQRLGDRIANTLGVPVDTQGIEMGILEQDLASLLVQVEVERAGLSNRIDELLQIQANQRQRAKLLPQLETTQRQLERQLTVAQSTYETLLQRLQDVQVAQNKTIDNIRVVSRALVPQDPTFGKKLIVAAGVLVGSVLAVITAFVLDLCDRSVKTITEAQEVLGLPILGVIPTLDKRIPVIMPPNHDGTPQMPHPYVLLQANLSFVTAQTHDKVILVTSSVAEEGRSRVTANLAIAMAQAGKHVLLIDADLHKPTQHQIWECRNDMGLRQVLNHGAEPLTAIQAIGPNLSLLPSGQGHEHNLEPFNPQMIGQLLQQMAHRFDVVLLDTSPVTQMPDASTLGALADATLIVVRPKQAQMIDLKAAKVLMELSGKPTLGIVANGVAKGTNPMQYLASSSGQVSVRTQQKSATVRPTETLLMPVDKGSPVDRGSPINAEKPIDEVARPIVDSDNYEPTHASS
ncbi:MAG: polysaccharide biosynthesis tyrosine autokinase [Merismopedia sp. SIO2A8]|nr:polysaccharide biosynthesis tyrosine autokinase [Merismopedia sp. SIO2A8]